MITMRFMGFAGDMAQKMQAIGFVMHTAKIVFFTKMTASCNQLGIIIVYFSGDFDTTAQT